MITDIQSEIKGTLSLEDSVKGCPNPVLGATIQPGLLSYQAESVIPD